MSIIKLFELETEKKLTNEYLLILQNLIKNNDYILGDSVSTFEDEFSNFLDSKYCVAVNSGTDALEVSLRLLDISQGDEVIVPAFTFYATTEVILKVGATPIFCDIDPNSLTINIKKLENLITKKTKAIIPVHLFGNSADLRTLKKVVNNNQQKIHIIEDVAQAFGSKFNNKYLGTAGEFGCFSFYPTKNLGAFGDGGSLIFNNKKYLNRAKTLRNHGMTEKYFHSEVGYNSRLDNFQAEILTLKLKNMDYELSRKIEINNYYLDNINNEMLNLHSQPNQPMNVQPISTIGNKLNKKLKKLLDKNFIQYGDYYPYAQYEFPMFKYSKSLKNVEHIKQNIVTLPNHSKLNKKNQDKIINLLNDFK